MQHGNSPDNRSETGRLKDFLIGVLVRKLLWETSMHRLSKYPIENPPEITELRKEALHSASAPSAMIELGLALTKIGCNYEASWILRPLRSEWKSTPAAPDAKAALGAQAWWNKHGLEFARLKHAGKRAQALKLLGSRAVDYWDQPALLMHLSEFLAEDLAYDLSAHLLRRIAVLADRGLPKMDMTAFSYVSRAALVDLLLRQGRMLESRAAYEQLPPPAANAMGHEILGIRTLAAIRDLDRAMVATAALLVVAEKKRRGYSRDIRLEFVATSGELTELRSHDDWSVMLGDPQAYLRTRGVRS